LEGGRGANFKGYFISGTEGVRRRQIVGFIVPSRWTRGFANGGHAGWVEAKTIPQKGHQEFDADDADQCAEEWDENRMDIYIALGLSSVLLRNPFSSPPQIIFLFSFIPMGRRKIEIQPITVRRRLYSLPLKREP
jgi:hypothetical protein